MDNIFDRDNTQVIFVLELLILSQEDQGDHLQNATCQEMVEEREWHAASSLQAPPTYERQHRLLFAKWAETSYHTSWGKAWYGMCHLNMLFRVWGRFILYFVVLVVEEEF